MKFVTYNIQYGKGVDGAINLGRIIDEIVGAEVIALQEVERYWPRSGNIDQVQVIADALRDYFWVYAPGVDLHIEGGAVASDAQNMRRQFGNMLLARTPILTTRHHLLPKYGSTDAPSIQRSALEVTVRCGDRVVRVYSVHLTHLSAITRRPQVKALLRIHRNAAVSGAPVCGDLRGLDWADAGDLPAPPDDAILLGDFNFQPDCAEYDLIVGPPGDYGGRIANPRGFVDAWCAAGNDPAGGFTSDVNDAPARLDYGFVSNALKHLISNCYVNEKASGSDHFPLWMEIDW